MDKFELDLKDKKYPDEICIINTDWFNSWKKRVNYEKFENASNSAGAGGAGGGSSS